MKTCYRCKKLKPPAEFGNCTRFKDGLRKECKECSRAEALDYRNKNLEQQRQSKRDWASRNQERILEYARTYRAEHREQVLAAAASAYWKRKETDYQRLRDTNKKAARKYAKRYPGKINARTAKRLSARLQAMPARVNMFFVGEAYNLAQLRTRITGIKWHVDHIIPLRSRLVCGLHIETNLRVVPAIENLRKGATVWPDMP